MTASAPMVAPKVAPMVAPKDRSAPRGVKVLKAAVGPLAPGSFPSRPIGRPCSVLLSSRVVPPSPR